MERQEWKRILTAAVIAGIIFTGPELIALFGKVAAGSAVASLVPLFETVVYNWG